MTQRFTIMAAVDLSDYSAMTATLQRMVGQEGKRGSAFGQRHQPNGTWTWCARAMVGYEAFSLPNYIEEQVKDRKARMKEFFEGGLARAVSIASIW